MAINISQIPSGTKVNFTDKSFIKKMIEGKENEPKDIWESMPEIDLGLEKNPSFDNTYIGIESLDLKKMFLFIYACAPEKFKAEFAKNGIEITDPHDLEILISMAEKGEDKSMNMNFKDIVGGICLDSNEVNNALRSNNFNFGC